MYKKIFKIINLITDKGMNTMYLYDYVIVGSGLFGAVFTQKAIENGKKCLVIEKRKHIGGNAYTEEIEGIQVHRYGAHIFHTNDKEIWDYVNLFAEFNNYVNSPIANYNGEIFNLPFNMNTFNKMWGVITPDQAKEKIESSRVKLTKEPQNLEEQAVSLVGYEIYEKLIKGYTEKQWGRKCKDLPASIIKRLPCRFTYDNNYFNDRYQGIPIGGYTKMIEKMLKGSEIKTDINFLDEKEKYCGLAKTIIYTGAIDEFYNYEYGPLEYRSLKFETQVLDIPNYQGVAVVNYTDSETPYTRIIEHKHFEFGTQPKTVITNEYSVKWEPGFEPYYPVNDFKNQKRFEQYKELSKKDKNIIFCGRLGEYKYYDMKDVIQSALKLSQSILK